MSSDLHLQHGLDLHLNNDLDAENQLEPVSVSVHTSKQQCQNNEEFDDSPQQPKDGSAQQSDESSEVSMEDSRKGSEQSVFNVGQEADVDLEGDVGVTSCNRSYSEQNLDQDLGLGTESSSPDEAKTRLDWIDLAGIPVTKHARCQSRCCALLSTRHMSGSRPEVGTGTARRPTTQNVRITRGDDDVTRIRIDDVTNTAIASGTATNQNLRDIESGVVNKTDPEQDVVSEPIKRFLLPFIPLGIFLSLIVGALAVIITSFLFALLAAGYLVYSGFRSCLTCEYSLHQDVDEFKFYFVENLNRKLEVCKSHLDKTLSPYVSCENLTSAIAKYAFGLILLLSVPLGVILGGTAFLCLVVAALFFIAIYHLCKL